MESGQKLEVMEGMLFAWIEESQGIGSCWNCSPLGLATGKMTLNQTRWLQRRTLQLHGYKRKCASYHV